MKRTIASKRKFKCCQFGSIVPKPSLRVLIGLSFTVFGGVMLTLDIYPSERAEALVLRVLPVLVFAICMNAVSVLSRQAGFFTWVAAGLARIAGNSRLGAFFLFSFATISLTTFLSLDTTVVMLVPAVVCFAAAAKMNPRPLIYTVVWLANTASLLLPISNLTNLLAQQRLGNMSVFAFAKLTFVPWLVGAILPIVLLLFLERKTLFGADVFARWEDYEVISEAEPSRHRTSSSQTTDITFSGIVILILCTALLCGAVPWLAALIAASALFCYLQFTGVMRPQALVPAQMTVLLVGLFFGTDVIVYLCQDFINGLASVGDAGADTGLSALFGAAGIGMLGANLGNNLPAYLAFEPLFAAGTPVSSGSSSLLISLLIGVNIGPIITPWASLATLLWHERLVTEGLQVSWGRFIRRGLILGPVTVFAATFGLYFAL